MQQRSNLCRALIHEPELLMLDEPFGALDAFTREELWGVMQALWLEKRFTGVLVTHDLREAVFLADTVYVMSRRPGRIVLSKKIDIPRPRTLATTFEPQIRRDRPRTARPHPAGARMTELRREALKHAMPWLVMAGLLIVWEISCIVFDVPEIILPRPTKIFAVFVQRFDVLMAYCWDTLWTTTIGFLLAIAGGLLLGLAIGASPFVYSGLYPLLIAFNAIPKVAIVPILMIWVGVGSLPAVITAFVISFFPIVVNVATGLATIEPEMRDVLRSLGATRLEILTKVGIPRAMPYLFASLKVAITLGLHRLGDLRDGGRQQRHRLPHAVGQCAQRRAHHLRRPVRHRHHGRADVRRLRHGRKAHDPLGLPRRDRGLALGIEEGLRIVDFDEAALADLEEARRYGAGEIAVV